MNQACVGLLVAAALVAMPLTASAQKKPPQTAQKEINLDEPEEAQPAEAGTEPVEGPAGEGEGESDAGEALISPPFERRRPGRPIHSGRPSSGRCRGPP